MNFVQKLWTDIRARLAGSKKSNPPEPAEPPTAKELVAAQAEPGKRVKYGAVTTPEPPLRR